MLWLSIHAYITRWFNKSELRWSTRFWCDINFVSILHFVWHHNCMSEVKTKQWCALSLHSRKKISGFWWSSTVTKWWKRDTFNFIKLILMVYYGMLVYYSWNKENRNSSYLWGNFYYRKLKLNEIRFTINQLF